jgi:hypothetical protein
LKSVVRRRWRRQKLEERRAVAAEKRRSHDGGLRSGFGDLRSSVNSSVKTATAWGRTDPTAAARDWAVVVVKTAPGMKLAAPDRAACRYLDPPSYGMMRRGVKFDQVAGVLP